MWLFWLWLASLSVTLAAIIVKIVRWRRRLEQWSRRDRQQTQLLLDYIENHPSGDWSGHRPRRHIHVVRQ